MTKLTNNFQLVEFTRSATANSLGIDNTPTAEHLGSLKFTASKLEEIRALLGGLPIIISSGYRNPSLNKAVGGVLNSAHALGLAADFSCPSFGTPFEVFKKIAESTKCGSGISYDQLIFEDSGNSQWVHIGFTSGVPRNQTLIYRKGVYSAYSL